MSKGDALTLEVEQLVRERAWRETWLRLAGIGIVAKRPTPSRAGRPPFTAPRPRWAPVVRYRRFGGEVVLR